MRIVVIGANSGTSRQRNGALRRLGHDVHVIDPYAFLGRSRWMGWWLSRTGGIGVSFVIDARIKRRVIALDPDLTWVDHGAFLGPKLIQSLSATGKPIVNYMIDNAWSCMHRRRTRRYRAALPYYDLAVVMRVSNVIDARAAGARRVHRVNQTANEVDHAPRDLSEETKQFYASEVAFVG